MSLATLSLATLPTTNHPTQRCSPLRKRAVSGEYEGRLVRFHSEGTGSTLEDVTSHQKRLIPQTPRQSIPASFTKGHKEQSFLRL